MRSDLFIVDGVTIGRPFNLERVIRQHGRDVIPNSLGIYYLFHNSQLVYIGMSRDIRGRLLSHLKDEDMPFNNCLWFLAKSCDNPPSVKRILEIEYAMIKKYKPVLNREHTIYKYRSD